MLAPTGYKQVIDSRAYMAARVAAAKRVGILRWALPMLVLGAALVCAAAVTLIGHTDRLWYVVSAAVLVCVAAVIATLWLKVFPDAVKREAKRDYESYDRLCNPADVTFSSDDMTVQSAVLTRTVAYAKTRLCIETPRRFVLVTDEETVVVLEKACFTKREETELFLRGVFARRYVKERER